jgi:hypothetical protein
MMIGASSSWPTRVLEKVRFRPSVQGTKARATVEVGLIVPRYVQSKMAILAR